MSAPDSTWVTPDAHTMGDALALAQKTAAHYLVPVTITARVHDRELGFDILLSSGYIEARERGQAVNPAVASVMPNGAIELHRPLAGLAQIP